MISGVLKWNKFPNRSLLIIIAITFVAAFTGVFEILFSPYHFTFTFTLYIDSIHFHIPFTFYLNSVVLMLGIGAGTTSIFNKRKNNYWFYGSILIILVGIGIMSAYLGYVNPIEIGTEIYPLNSFPVEFIKLAINNIFYAFLALLTGPTIIGPYILLSKDIIIITTFFTSIVSSYGYKGIIFLLGLFHWYPETYAIFLSCLAGIKVALQSFKAFMHIRRDGFRDTFRTIKETIVFELRSTMPKLMVLLIIAALLETLWAPFWTNYWIQHIL
jgi:hypothetical protein